jgi:hypothetical protein
MSYKYRVLSDLPLGYWRLNKLSTIQYNDALTTYDTTDLDYNAHTNDHFIDYSILQNGANILNGSVPQLNNVTPIVTSLSNEDAFNSCKILNNNEILISNLYNAFKKGYENKTFGIEMWVLLQNPTQPVDLIKLGQSSSSMKIRAEKDSICFYVSNDQGVNTVTTKKVYSWDEPLHIFALIKDKSMTLYINGLSDESVTFNGYFYEDLKNFYIGPSPENNGFIISDLAFYDKPLSVNEIKSHMSWAHRDSNPIGFAHQSSASVFLFNDNSGEAISVQNFYAPISYSQGTFNNVETDQTGIVLKKNQQSGSWTYPLDITSYQNFSGINVSWETASYPFSTTSNNYVSVSISYDGGTTYYPIKNNNIVPYFVSNYYSSLTIQALIKVDFYYPSNYVNDNYVSPPRLDNLSIKVYSNIDSNSDTGIFNISPFTSNQSVTEYTYRGNKNNILSRSSNLGINFYKMNPESKPGSAIINPSGYGINNGYRHIDFWFKWAGQGKAVLDIGGTPQLFIDNQGYLNVHTTSPFQSSVYINGVLVGTPNWKYKLSVNEPIHIFISFNSNIYLASANPTTGITDISISINGDRSGQYDPCEASYGNIILWGPNTSPNPSKIYLSYLSTNVLTVNDGVTSMGSVLEYSGTSSQINGGDPVIYHTHV